jgi:putative acetyltransferase
VYISTIQSTTKEYAMIIRNETPNDYTAIRDILIAAFADHPYSRQTEHLIVEALRDAGALEAGLVAEIGGIVVGHIAFSKAEINGADCMWYLLGPVAATPSMQRQGIGKELIKRGLAVIRGMGAKGCVLVGDPAYYTRLGFANSSALHMEGVPAENILCMPFDDHVPEGEVTHHPAFTVGLSK